MQESIILSELIKNKPYAIKVLPHLKVSYFEELSSAKIFDTIKKYTVKYKKLPTLTEVGVELSDNDKLNENLFASCMSTLNDIKTYDDKLDIDWLVDKTEEFCIIRSAQNALMKASDIIDSGNVRKVLTINSLIEQSLRVNFNRDIGIEFFNEEDIDKRWDTYNEKKIKYRTHISKLNQITGGGLEPKKVHVFFGDTHVGKCTFENTKVTVRNKLTNKIETITIGEFHKRFEK